MWSFSSSSKKFSRLGMLALSLCAVTGLACARPSYPSGPITLVVPFPPGGSVDVVARAVGKSLGMALDTPVIVENHAGASGNIGAVYAAHKKSDGQTLFVTSSGVLTANQFLYKNPGFDTKKDFTPVIKLADQPNILLVHYATTPVKSVQDLIKLAKAKPGKINVGNAGIGTGQDIAARQFESMTGVNMLNVPYRGGAPALNDLLAGQINIMFDVSPEALPYAKDPKSPLRAIAITSAKRSPLVPDLPTVAESGLPGYESITWIGVVAPAGTPSAIVDRLNTELNKGLKGELGKTLVGLSLQPVGGTPAYMAKMIANDTANYGTILKAAGVKPQ